MVLKLVIQAPLVLTWSRLVKEMVNELSVKAEGNMLESGDKKGVIKRLFNILVEGLQNIRLHGRSIFIWI